MSLPSIRVRRLRNIVAEFPVVGRTVGIAGFATDRTGVVRANDNGQPGGWPLLGCWSAEPVALERRAGVAESRQLDAGFRNRREGGRTRKQWVVFECCAYRALEALVV